MIGIELKEVIGARVHMALKATAMPSLPYYFFAKYILIHLIFSTL